MKTVGVTGSFDNLRSEHVRFLEEAGKLGALHVLLWSDEVVAALTGKPPKFPFAERHYLVQAIRYVNSVGQHKGVRDPDSGAFRRLETVSGCGNAGASPDMCTLCGGDRRSQTS